MEELACLVGGKTGIVDPYSGRSIDFADESEAYPYFMNHVGIDAYGDVLKAELKPVSNQTELIGFSVGASAIWKISDRIRPEFIVRAVCFYGSQIRHHQEIDPCLDVELVLPDFEPGFHVDALAQQLSAKAHVIIHKTKYLHGFMNPHSKNFNHIGYRHYVEWLSTVAG